MKVLKKAHFTEAEVKMVLTSGITLLEKVPDGHFDLPKELYTILANWCYSNFKVGFNRVKGICEKYLRTEASPVLSLKFCDLSRHKIRGCQLQIRNCQQQVLLQNNKYWTQDKSKHFLAKWKATRLSKQLQQENKTFLLFPELTGANLMKSTNPEIN
jgi:hypothetical protein